MGNGSYGYKERKMEFMVYNICFEIFGLKRYILWVREEVLREIVKY